VSRCPVAQVDGRRLEDRLVEPGLDFYCMTNIGRGRKDRHWTSGITGEKQSEPGILALAEDGVVLQPAVKRLQELEAGSSTKVNTFIIDMLAGDTDYLFCSVNYPPPIFGGTQLLYEPDMFRQMEELGAGTVAYRPFDLKVSVYERIGLPDNRGHGRDFFEPYAELRREGLETGRKIAGQDLAHLRSLNPANLAAVVDYMQALAGCFTVYGYDNALAFAQLMGQLKAGDMTAQELLDVLGDSAFFEGPKDRIIEFSGTYTHADFLDLWGKTFQSQFEFLGDGFYAHDSWGEWLWKGDLPICCAEGTAAFDIPGGNYTGYQYVEDSFEPFPPGTCDKGWRW
jgi:hypothetical protein